MTTTPGDIDALAEEWKRLAAESGSTPEGGIIDAIAMLRS